jgi:hypothetical protein
MSAPPRLNLAARRAHVGLGPLDDEAGPGEGDVAALLQRRPPDPSRDG